MLCVALGLRERNSMEWFNFNRSLSPIYNVALDFSSAFILYFCIFTREVTTDIAWILDFGRKNWLLCLPDHKRVHLIWKWCLLCRYEILPVTFLSSLMRQLFVKSKIQTCFTKVYITGPCQASNYPCVLLSLVLLLMSEKLWVSCSPHSHPNFPPL